MKKTGLVIGFCVLVLSACVSAESSGPQAAQASQAAQAAQAAQASQAARKAKPKVTLLKPADIVDKPMSGSDEDGDFGFLFKQDGTLEYTVNDTVNTGTWEYNESYKILRYKLDWIESGQPKGYGADITMTDDEITINAHWYLTDAYITMLKKARYR